jgi:hypothetical protein
MPRTENFRRVLLVSISIAALSACSSSSSDQAKTSAPMPPITEMDSAMDSPAPQQIELSGSDTLTPVMPRAMTSDTTTEERLARLEQSVVEMQGNYEKLGPAFASLNTTNARIQALLNEIEKETGKKVALVDAPAPVVLAPSTTTTVTTTKTPVMKTETVKVEETVPATGVVLAPGSVSKANVEPVKTVTNTTTTVTTPAAAPPLSALKEQPNVEEARAEAERHSAAKTTPAAGGANSVTGVRIGEHGSKTRLVFDLNGNTKPSFKYDLDNAEKILLVEMPSAGWSAGASGKPKSPLIESWNATEGASGGSSVAIQLKKDARVISTEFLKAEGKDPARLVVDIAPQG